MRKEKIIEILKKLDFVSWDRFSGNYFYGWIDREGDNYKDFIVLKFSMWDVNFVSSSKKFTKKITEILNKNKSCLKNCERIEGYCDLENVIRLKKGVENA